MCAARSSYIRFNDTDDEYEPSDSDDDLGKHEKRLLQEVRQKPAAYSDSEEDVLGVHSSEDDDDDDDESHQSDLALSDVEPVDEDKGLPDLRAWGKSYKNYYATDYVDPDYGGFQGQDAVQAEFEEEEAKKLHMELVKTMDDDDYGLDFFTSQTKKVEPEPEDTTAAVEVIKTDITSLSKREQIQILRNEAPEFFDLVEDLKSKMELVRDELQELIDLHKNDKIAKSEAMDFVVYYHQLILNYGTNIQMYLLLKANRKKLETHPVIKRLYQYRQLLMQMDPVYDEVIRPQIELLLSNINERDSINQKEKKKTLKLLSKIITKPEKQTEAKPTKSKKKKISELDDEEEIDEDALNAQLAKRPKMVDGMNAISDDSSDDDDEPIGEEDAEQVEDDNAGDADDGGDTRRAITYQIAKNKGLISKRKKEQRNPRVKHRNKYRKAKIRRKGAVREVRTEMSRYGGEASGIKASVTKSVKIR